MSSDVNLPSTNDVLSALTAAEDAKDLFDIYLDYIRAIGFSDYSYLAGAAVRSPNDTVGSTVQAISHFSSCDGTWMETLFADYTPEQDYDIERMMLGQSAPFISGHAITSLMPSLTSLQREILERKAEAGFAANLIIPLVTTPFSKVCHSAMMIISDMDLDTFVAAMTRNYHALAGMTHFVHHQLGGDAISYLERESRVATCIRKLEAGEPVDLRNRDSVFTARQSEVVALVIDGHRPEDISLRLKISRATVDRHIQAARKLVDARTNAELAAKAVALGLVVPTAC